MLYKLLFEMSVLLSWIAMAYVAPGTARAADPASAARSGPSPAPISSFAFAAGSAPDPTPCWKWEIIRDPEHPHWPGHYVHAPAACIYALPSDHQGPGAKGLTLRAGDKTLIRFGLHDAVTLIAAVALQDGTAGEVIRLRSDVGNRVLWGRIQPDGSTELTLRAASQQVVPADAQLNAHQSDRF